MIETNGLPTGWVSATIGELISKGGIFIDGDWVESKDQNPEGDVRLIQLADVGDGVYRNRSNRFLTLQKAKELRCTFLITGDVLIARMPDPLGRACIFPGDSKNAVTVVDVCVVRVGINGVSNKWLMNAINSLAFRTDIAALQSGSTRKRISRSNLATLSLPIPPLPEQQRIVTKLEELFTRLDAGIQSLKDAKKQLKRYRQSVLKAAVEGALTKAWREQHKDELEPASLLLQRILKERREKWEADQLAKMQASGKLPKDDGWKSKYQEPATTDSVNLPSLPDEWMWVSLETPLLDIEAGKSFKCEERPPVDSEVGVVKVSAVTWGEFDDAESKTCLDKSLINPNYFISKGDFLFSRANTIDLVGACVIAKRVNRKVMLSDKILRFEIIGIPKEWVLIVLRSRWGRDEIEKLATGNQDSMRNIGQERIRQIRIPLTATSELEQIVAEVERRLSVTDKLELEIEASLKRAERLRQSILKRAFEGKLVPQHPDDEPAEKLLERIKAERAQREAEGLNGKRSTRKRKPPTEK